jgi:RNA polymerase sigma-70 factor (ECF subfamily)
MLRARCAFGYTMQSEESTKPDPAAGDNRLGELMRRAQDGDQAAYAALLRDAVGPILSMIARHYPGIRDREDVAQECLLTLHKIRHTYDPARPFLPWLAAIVRHRSLDHLRKYLRIQSREVQEELLVEQAAAPAVAGGGDKGEDAARWIAALPERERAVIQLLKIDGLPVKDVAERLGLSESNVKVIASRGYEKLRRAWKDRRPDENG